MISQRAWNYYTSSLYSAYTDTHSHKGDYKPEDFPGAEDYFQSRCLSIPMHPNLTNTNQEKVMQSTFRISFKMDFKKFSQPSANLSSLNYNLLNRDGNFFSGSSIKKP